MSEGVDYSSARPGGARLKAAGKHFAMRYLAEDQRGITTAERDDLHANGVAIGFVYESTANRAREGRNAGLQDGFYAHRLAARLDIPADIPIYFAVDYDAPESDQPLIDEYLRAVGLYILPSLVGVYGSYYVVKRCMENGSAAWGWQTYAWSGGHVYDGAHLLQYSNGEWNGDVDFNRSLKENFGQWPSPGQEEDMALLEEVVKALGGIEAIRAWNENGNSLLLGYAQEQNAQASIAANLEAVSHRIAACEGHMLNHPATGGPSLPKGSRLSVEVV